MKIKKSKTKIKFNSGFTIVELLIVIVIIGVLAVITVVSYTGVTQRATEATIKSDLNNATKVVMIEYTSTGKIPSVFPSGFKNSNNVGLSLADTGNVDTFCINAQSVNASSPTYIYYLSSEGGIKNGSCSGNVIVGSEKNLPSNIVTDNAFEDIGPADWHMVISNDSGYTLTTRAGVSSDPIINKPVLNLTNNTAKSLTWSIVFGNVKYTDIVSGGNYKFSVWTRRIGNFVGNIVNFNVINANGLYPALSTWPNFTPVDSWRLYTSTGTASVDGIVSNGFYLPISTAAFNTTGWSLEFQDPQLVRI